jgi:hypothetical protein
LGVVAYGIAEDAICVQFAKGAAYVYSYASNGRDQVEQMKALALAGAGLSTYISQHVKDHYEERLDPPVE